VSATARGIVRGMAPGPRQWEPANDVERTLRHAWERDDTGLYLRTLAVAPLYLPGFDDQRARTAGEPVQRLLTRQRGGRTFLLVFTSPEALYDAVGEVVDGWRLTTVAELAQAWPDPEWGLVVSPTAPVGAYLDPDEFKALAGLVADEPVFHPVGRAEALMFGALRTSDPGSYLDVLVVSRVLLPLSAPAAAEDLGRPRFPWRVETLDGLPTISVFTSAQRLAEVVPEPVPTTRVDIMALAQAWPDPSWRLAVNPGSAIAATFTGGQVADLVDWARGLVGRLGIAPDGPVNGEDVPAQAPLGAVPELEMEIEPSAVERYLSDGYDRVSGVVQRAGTAAVPVDGYVVRWHHEVAAGPVPVPGQAVRDLPVPSGARMYRRLAGGESLLASYQAELGRWIPAVVDLLRGLTG